MKTNNDINLRLSWGMAWLFLFVLCFIGLMTVVLLAQLISTGSKQVNLSIVATLQNIIAFVAPVLIMAIVWNKMSGNGMLLAQLQLDKSPSWFWLLIVVLGYVVSLPCMNYIVDWNQHVHLPSRMSDLEQVLRQSEDLAEETTKVLLDIHSLSGLIAMLVVVAFLTGFSEELFFRCGLLSPMLKRGVNKHLAVWTVAIIFSAFHFQFFGFVPRVLLGVWLGYLLVASRSLWVPIIAHALNNGVVVVGNYMTNTRCDVSAIDKIGLTSDGDLPYLAVVSAILWGAIICYILLRNIKTVK